MQQVDRHFPPNAMRQFRLYRLPLGMVARVGASGHHRFEQENDSFRLTGARLGRGTKAGDQEYGWKNRRVGSRNVGFQLKAATER